LAARLHTMMPVQACCICGKASHSYGKKNLYYNIPMFGCLCGSSAHARRPGQRIWLNEQGRSRDHESSDEGDQTRKQHDVAQEHTHTRLLLHLFCAGRLASEKYGPCSPELKNHENWQSVPISPRPRTALLYPNLCIVVLRPSRCSFAETKTRVRRMRMG
jgi:hypothetical protein